MPPSHLTHDGSDMAPLHALLLPFDSGVLAWPRDGDALFLRARDGWPLRPHAARGLRVEQPFRPDADALERAGYALDDDAGVPASLVLVLPPRQREEMRTLFARAVDRCAEGGMVVAALANDAGARSGERDFKALCGLDGSLAKHHCRVFWACKNPARIDRVLLDAWRALDAPRRIADARLPQGGFVSRPGVFAWNRIDPASVLLAAHLPADLSGVGADLGAGWGYLAIEVLRRSPKVRAFDLYEADARALALAKDNVGAIGTDAVVGYHWHDVTAGLPSRYDFIVSNPPFHAHDRIDRPELGQRFVAVAAQALAPGGRLFLVANQHLPYEAALDLHFGTVRVLAQGGGFKAIEATVTARAPRPSR